MKICLNLIVKNESHVIERCLDSLNNLYFSSPSGDLRHAVEAVAILDTGSTDTTISQISTWIEKNGKKGGVKSQPWTEPFFNFSINRNHALDYAYEVLEKISKKKDNWYILITDADNLIFSTEGNEKKIILPELQADNYLAQLRRGVAHYDGTFLIRFKPEQGWEWHCGLHEFVSAKEDVTTERLSCLWVSSGCEGFRSQDSLKYVRDVKLLRGLIERIEKFKKREVRGAYEEDEIAQHDRYCFYLAQSLRDSGSDLGSEKEAEKAYLKRAKLGGWKQEVYVCYVEAFKLREKRKGKPDPIGLDYLGQAFNIDPERLEAPYYLIKALNSESFKRFHQSWHFAKPLLSKKKPEGCLFIEAHVYEYAFFDEASVSCFYTGEKKLAKAMFEKQLQNPKLPSHHHDRIRGNIRFCD
nr:glycosyltransferase family 2 [Pithovirus mammoth]